jgi:hypothetical protein
MLRHDKLSAYWTVADIPRRIGKTRREPDLNDLLADPTFRVLMKADGVLWEDVLELAEKIPARRLPPNS